MADPVQQEKFIITGQVLRTALEFIAKQPWTQADPIIKMIEKDVAVVAPQPPAPTAEVHPTA